MSQTPPSPAQLRPVIGLPTCVVEKDGMPFHWVGDKYVRAVAVSAGGLPLTIPSLGDLIDPEGLVGQLDGLLLTGSPSNVYPPRYGADPDPDAAPYVVRVDRRRGTVWIGTGHGDVVYSFDPAAGAFTAYPLPTRGALVRHIDVDEQTGDLWAAYGASPGIPGKVLRIQPAR